MTAYVRVARGRGETIGADREATRKLLEHAAAGTPAVRVWTPHRQLAFGRRDAVHECYEGARAAARKRGFPPVERRVGGRAVAYDGETTLAFARAEPVADPRRGIRDRFDRLTAEIADALRTLDVPVERGEPPGSFCPGTHSLQVASASESGDGPEASVTESKTAGDTKRRTTGGKLVGIAQRVTNDAALVAGVLVTDDPAPLTDVLTDVYGALNLSFDPDSVGSVTGAGGPADPDAIARVIEGALVGDAVPEYEPIDA